MKDTKIIPNQDFAARVQILIDRAGGQSALARMTGLSLGAIQRYLKGGEPTRGALMRLAEHGRVSMGWLVYGIEDGSTPAAAKLPVYGFAECGLQGWYNAVPYRLNTALDWPDPDLYAVIAAGHSMAPEGIHPGFVCIISPNTKIYKGDAVLIRKKDGTVTIKLYISEDDTRLTVRGWLDPEKPGGEQTPYTDMILKSHITETVPVVMVKRRT